MDRKLRRSDIDRLLREALAEQGPADAQRLAGAVRTAWALARDAGAPTPNVVRAPAAIPAPGGSWLLAAAAAVMLAVGLALHLALPPRLVADSLSARQAAIRIDAQIRRAVAMTVRLEATDERGKPSRYRIAWRAPGETQVEVESEGGVARRHVRIPHAWAGLFGPGAGHEEADPLLRPARDFLSPDRVAALLDRLRVSGVPARVTIDPRTDLPLRLEAGATARFEWEPTPDPLVPLHAAGLWGH